jgi:hypothetical protein
MVPREEHEKLAVLSGCVALAFILAIEIFAVVRLGYRLDYSQDQHLSVWEVVFRDRR